MATGAGIDLGSTLQWARFIDDASILDSANKAELKDHLEKLLSALRRKYTVSAAASFPTNAELNKLTSVVEVLAKQLNVRKAGFSHLYGAMRRIENRWTKMPLIGFADELLKRLMSIPYSPNTVINQARKKCGVADRSRSDSLCQIVQFLEVRNPANSELKPDWEKWFEAVQGLEFASSFLAATSNQNRLKAEFKSALMGYRSLLAFLFFMDLRRQQLEWYLNYARQTEASLAWLYSLQRPEYFIALEKVFYSSAPSPERMTKVLADLNNRDRRNRCYRKQKAFQAAK